MALAWLTDIHLNFVSEPAVRAFGRSVVETGADAVVITGDIAEAPSLVDLLEIFAEGAAPLPVYFVLGNHDYYRGSFDEVRGAARALTARHERLAWLPALGTVELSPSTALVGCDGWGDARYGDFANSTVMLNDYVLIQDLRAPSLDELTTRLHAEGDRWGAWVRVHLPPALERHEHVIFATHVPPFDGACWHEGRISDDNWLPHFTCKAVGDALLECADAHPRARITVLCGHTHGAGTMRARDNLEVWTGGADYGAPAVQRLV